MLEDPEDNSISNVLKLHLLLGGDLHQPGNNVIDDQLSFYYPGVGTYGSWFDKLRNILKAPPSEDVGTIIKSGFRDLYQNYEVGDQVFLFGFSRGAAIARRFASVLKDTFEAIKPGIPAPQIEFIGVFDTVAAIKKPNLFKEEIKPASDVVFENGTISPSIKEALHLVSLDDRRIPFMPTLMNKDVRVKEIWFPGAHSDIGGGYRHDGLSDYTLQFMVDYFKDNVKLGLSFLSPAEVNYKDLFDGSYEPIQYEDVIIQPNFMGKNHEQSAITKIKKSMLNDRTPRVNINDKHSMESPVIHHCVFDRMVRDKEYNPKSLANNLKNPYTGENTEFYIWNQDGLSQNTYINLEDAKLESKVNPYKLNVGNSKELYVMANVKFNQTGVLVDKGEKYSFKIDVKQKWYDASIECTPKGWTRKNKSLSLLQKPIIWFMEDNRRHPKAKWFEIIGTINRNDIDNFKILDHISKTEYSPTAKGELYLYANDLESKYGNNRGTIMLTITRKA